jgi:hypothetical protein
VYAHIVTLVPGDNHLQDMLHRDDLREVDVRIVDYLTEGRVTPAYARKRLSDDDIGEYTRGYVQQRLARLVEHGHATNLYDTGLYELTNTPLKSEN